MLIYDGYRAHLWLDVLDLFNRNNLFSYALPAHTSGKLQPLDTVLFSAFNNALNAVANACQPWTERTLPYMFHFCTLLKEAYLKAITFENIRASFRRAGIWPFNPMTVLNVPLSADSAEDAEIMSAEELEEAFEKKRSEFRNIVVV